MPKKKPKPKPRTVWLIENAATNRFFHNVGHTEKEAREFRDKHFPKAKIVKATVIR